MLHLKTIPPLTRGRHDSSGLRSNPDLSQSVAFRGVPIVQRIRSAWRESETSRVHRWGSTPRPTVVLLGLVLAGISLSCPQAWAQQAKRKRRPPVPETVGPAIRENRATPVDRINAAEGFKVELLYSVPGVEQGSWVNLCTDHQQRLIVSDQFGGLYRITPPNPGETISPDDVQPLDLPIRAVNGMAWAFDSLYVAVNDYENKMPSGFYRLTDENGDGDLDTVTCLREMVARRDHGIHAIVPTEDGQALYLICGNSTQATETVDSSPVPSVWGEDHLLPRLPDGRGFMRDTLGPGGKVYRVSPDGRSFELFATGFRNIFDAALNRSGDLFTYDADMEYDFNTSWYRPTRINHVVSGADFGWRNGAGKRPEFYADTLPATLNIGPGSPTGVTFGYGARFPARYQDALFALDWSWGKVYAVHLEPEGASYRATKEEFLTGAPLPITDAIIHPGDGAMYFTIGGRRVQSGLYRVTYQGSESTEPVPTESSANHAVELVTVRERLEAFHGHRDSDAIVEAWPHLNSADPVIRSVARTALEHQPVAAWREKAIEEPDSATRIAALLALSRAGGTCPEHRDEGSAPVDRELGNQILDALISIDPASLDRADRVAWQRTIQIALHRFGPFDQARLRSVTERLSPLFPAGSAEENWLLCETLVFLQAPGTAEKAMALIREAPSQEEQIEYARSLRMLRAGWTLPLRKEYIRWLLTAANYRGGASFEKFISFIRRDALATLSDEERGALAALIAQNPVRKSVLESVGEVFKGREPTEWTLEQLSASARTGMSGRDFAQGRKMFAASGCFACHRFDNQGGMTGPDLTSAGRRYSTHDFLDQILHPSKVINEQFSAVRVLTDEGKIYTGVVVNLKGDTVTLNTDLTDPNQRVSIDRKTVEVFEASKTSAMPEGLLSRMTETEVLDLVAYVLSGGDPKHNYFDDAR